MNHFLKIFHLVSVLLLVQLAAGAHGSVISKISLESTDDTASGADFYGDDGTTVGADDTTSSRGDDFYGYDFYADDGSSGSSSSGSSSNSPILSFTSNITLSNVAGLTIGNYDLDAVSQEAVYTTNALVMGISTEYVVYLETVLVSGDNDADDDGGSVNETLRSSFTTTATDDATPVSSIIAVTKTSVPLYTTGYLNATDAYNNLVGLLTTAVSNGSYTILLNSQSDLLGATQTANAQAVSVSNSGATVTTNSGGGGSDGNNMLNKDEKIGILIAIIIVGLAIVAGIVYWCSKRQSSDDDDDYNRHSLLGLEQGTNKSTEDFVKL